MSLPPELAAAVADVRSNGSATDWCLCGYADGAELTLKMVGSGTGGADALAAQLTHDNVYYGLVRTYEQIDATRAVKFVFLSFVGEGVAAMKKAKISTLKGTITESFTPFHAEMLNASDPKEVTAAAVDALLGEMFGSAVDAPAGGAASIRIGMKFRSSRHMRSRSSPTGRFWTRSTTSRKTSTPAFHIAGPVAWRFAVAAG